MHDHDEIAARPGAVDNLELRGVREDGFGREAPASVSNISMRRASAILAAS